MVTDLQDELILLDAGRGVMFGLNGSGRALWQQLPASTAALTQHFQERYGLSAEGAQADILAVLSELEQRGLVKQT